MDSFTLEKRTQGQCQGLNGTLILPKSIISSGRRPVKLRLFPKKPYALAPCASAPCGLAQHPCRFESRVLSDYFKIMLMHSVKFSLINLILRFDIPACCIFNCLINLRAFLWLSPSSINGPKLAI